MGCGANNPSSHVFRLAVLRARVLGGGDASHPKTRRLYVIFLIKHVLPPRQAQSLTFTAPRSQYIPFYLRLNIMPPKKRSAYTKSKGDDGEPKFGKRSKTSSAAKVTGKKFVDSEGNPYWEASRAFLSLTTVTFSFT